MAYALPNPPTPTQADFDAWVYGVMGIPVAALPITSTDLVLAYSVASSQVNLQLAQLPGPLYLLAVYNLAADYLVQWASDQPAPGGLYPVNNPGGLGYFAFLRNQWDIGGFTPGVVNSTSDEGTSTSLDVIEQLKGLTLGQLQNLKTPWGRQYLAYASSVGTLWGIT